ncbi:MULTISPECIES: SEC-C metal-binding domain-containing protein [unclassified Vibrio]|uniref:SEC-C metal-binding domain-containing protein n=1 Tax=Vibrio sp. HB236076 TaxID=3232307 RepID=A0AB39HB04_9VIBR|nr:SEC-C metal-binding domain-containing protein [Vibrio sp. HB161653]MDP5253716.1 SEC-C metal-binding domain-containing protein [Vibrio sp. HB161653]
MNYQLIDQQALPEILTAIELEGMMLAANMALEPLDPKVWLAEKMASLSDSQYQQIESQLLTQYHYLKSNQYALLALTCDLQSLAEAAEGFMQTWPYVEQKWTEQVLNDGTERMLQALLTTWMLAIDEAQTQQQMIAAGIDNPPSLSQLKPQLDLMINEVAQAADEIQGSGHAQSVNPYKTLGRNELCSCQSGKKFKHCCGR